jgi:tripartite-type tricarboxylate transporter receptor subunit TctC
MYGTMYYLSAAIMGLLWLASTAQATTHEFYKGKTIRIIVSAAAGGGFDTYSRTIARHMSKHVPGHPGIIVENMTGAGGLIAANYVYKVAKSDGLTIGNFAGGLISQQLLGSPGIEFDARKFEWIGVPVKDNIACAFTKASAITRIYTLPPGTPKERVQLLRQAFMATLKDPEFRAEAEKSKLDIDPVSGEEVEQTVARLFGLNAAVVAKLKQALAAN